MAKYYAAIAGLPNVTAEDRKLSLTCEKFVAQMQEEMTRSDWGLLALLLFERFNPQLIQYIEEAPENRPQTLSFGGFHVDMSAIGDVINSIKKKEKLPKSAASLPVFWTRYLKQRYTPQDEDDSLSDTEKEKQERWNSLAIEEDRLAMLYYEYLMAHKNKYIAHWAHFNLNIRNLLSAYTCRKLGWDVDHYIVGNDTVAQKIRTSKAKDFSITTEDIEHISSLLAIASEEDITRRERMLDMVKWNWIEDYTFFAPFSVDVLLGYYTKLSIVERWCTLNEETGEQTFRRIVTDLKSQCTDSLEEFKRNQKK